MKNCVFCQIIKGKIPAKKVYEDGEVLAFRDIHPVAPVHILIIPKKHISRLAEAKIEDCQMLGKIQIVAKKLAKKLGIGDAFRLLIANGVKAGQSVFHIHYHLIGGWGNGPPRMETK